MGSASAMTLLAPARAHNPPRGSEARRAEGVYASGDPFAYDLFPHGAHPVRGTARRLSSSP